MTDLDDRIVHWCLVIAAAGLAVTMLLTLDLLRMVP